LLAGSQGAAEQFIESGYRKSAEICGVWTSQSLMNRNAGGVCEMATEILVKDLREAFEQARALDGSMAERLDVFADATRKLHPSTAAIVDRLVARLKEHDAGKDAPEPGDVMPPFVLSDENGRLVNLKDLLAQGPVVITFHRGHWCPYCRISISTLVKAQPRIEAQGARMVAIVPDREEFAAEMKEDCNVSFPILCDM